MKRAELSEIMAIAFADHDIKISDARFEAWFMLAEKVDYETAKKAVRLLLGKKTYGPPKIADFMECVKEIQDAQDPRKSMTEGEAWGHLMKAVKSYGWCNQGDAIAYLRKVDPHLAQVAMQFGWQSICEWQTKDNAINKAHWWKCIASLKSRQEKFESLGLQEDPNKIGNSDKKIAETVQQLLPKLKKVG